MSEDVRFKHITFKAKRKDNGEEIVGSSIVTVEDSINNGKKYYFMLQRGDDLFAPIMVDLNGNCPQISAAFYQIDFSTLRMEIETESIDEVQT